MNPTLSRYTDILNHAPVGDNEVFTQFLSANLPDLWCGDYEAMTFTDDYPYSPAEVDIVSIALDKLT